MFCIPNQDTIEGCSPRWILPAKVDYTFIMEDMKTDERVLSNNTTNNETRNVSEPI
jgi:hypothetical protein